MASDRSFMSRLQGGIPSKGPGGAFFRGVGRSFGFDYEAGRSLGWMGRRAAGGVFGAGAGAFAFRAFGPVMLASSVSRGWQEGGVLGAAKKGAEEMAWWGAFEAGSSILTNPFVLGGAGGLAAGYGYYKLGEASRKHRKRLRTLEMGSDLVDRFGTLTTMRQRSLAAIQKTHVNGRLALGNESALLAASYR